MLINRQESRVAKLNQLWAGQITVINKIHRVLSFFCFVGLIRAGLLVQDCQEGLADCVV
jgi:hypothetical protein